jgi:hypothetical protein
MLQTVWQLTSGENVDRKELLVVLLPVPILVPVLWLILLSALVSAPVPVLTLVRVRVVVVAEQAAPRMVRLW